VGNAHITRSTNKIKEQEREGGVAALLGRGSAPSSRGAEGAGEVANLVEELRELDVRDPEDLIKTALRHGWTLGDLAEVVSCAAEYEIDSSLEELVGRPVAQWLGEIIPQGPAAAWAVLRKLIGRDLQEPPDLGTLAWFAREPDSHEWWRWRLQKWIEARREEAEGNPDLEEVLEEPGEPPWERR